MTTIYAAAIQEIAPDYNVNEVEAWMRSEHGTLDGLSRAKFDREVRIACATIDQAGPEMSAALARSYGF